MKLNIDFIDETELIEEPLLNQLEGLLQLAAELEDVQDQTELSVTFVNNERIQEINKEYRGKDQPTDVISFAMEEMGQGEIEIYGDQLPKHLGDLIISIEQARLQAEEYGHSYSRELGFLTVHGFLHLLGYDHMNEEDEKKMFSRQEEILHEYGLVR
ncbi:rRNA maturation RNase YbeY [Bacillus sp. AK128]